MNLEEKVDDLSNSVHEIKPMMVLIHETLQGMDVRQRSNEKEIENHSVEIQHINKDLDGIGAKFRDIERVQGIRVAGEAGKWVAFLEFLHDAPKWLKVISFTISFAIAAKTAAVWFQEAVKDHPLPSFWHTQHGEIP